MGPLVCALQCVCVPCGRAWVCVYYVHAFVSTDGCECVPLGPYIEVCAPHVSMCGCTDVISVPTVLVYGCACVCVRACAACLCVWRFVCAPCSSVYGAMCSLRCLICQAGVWRWWGRLSVKGQSWGAGRGCWLLPPHSAGLWEALGFTHQTLLFLVPSLRGEFRSPHRFCGSWRSP